MKRVCAWCGKTMGKDGKGLGITHGICEECEKRFSETPEVKSREESSHERVRR